MKIPKDAKIVEDRIVARGEATGHAHRLMGNPETSALVMRAGLMYIHADEEVSVMHEEHKPVTLDPKVWRVGRVSEFDHFKEEARAVAD